MKEPNAWWNTLRQEGVLVSPIVLDEWLPEGPPPVDEGVVDRVRQAYYRFVEQPERLRPFLDAVLEDFLGHSKPGFWRKEQNVPERYKIPGKRANRVLVKAGNEYLPRFIVVIDDEHVVDESGRPLRLGMHSGRKRYADLLRLMRASDSKLGLLTNGHHFRLVYAGLDHESWAEWSADAWFQGGEGRTAMWGFFAFLGIPTFPPDTDHNQLLDRVQESRERQADLSYVMGTQIREAVEILLEELTDSLAGQGKDGASILAPLRGLMISRAEELHALYQAAIRCIMRLVVQLYAESRSLLPKKDRLYYESYSVEGLYQLLRKAAADGREEDLRALRSAWPRLAASWHLVHRGSAHKDLQIQPYGGQLFRAPTQGETDPVFAALQILEDHRVHISDWAVHEILQKIRVGRFKIGRGKWRSGPVDFSDLRTEYIGMMYEGLLDYDLREARKEDGGIVFLSIGDQPALPLNLLESLSDSNLKTLLRDQVKKNRGDAEAESAVDSEEVESSVEEETESSETRVSELSELETNDELEDEEDKFLAKVVAWATRAVEAGGLFGCTPARLSKLDVPERKQALREAGHQLIAKSVPPGGLYLVRASGNRKGTGTFYTKPGLAIPTTIRALTPLVYDAERGGKIRPPNQILDLKVCDPAMGSGSFIVATLRFLAQSLKESFEEFVIPRAESGERVTETGDPALGVLTERILRTRREDQSGARTESVLKRAVVEHCIYGVDLNPLAVELGKLSLWIETMDPSLRFSFLDHKIKCGNSLIGTWRVQSEHYPLAAWERDAGDGARSPRTIRLQRIRKEVIIPQLKTYLAGFKLRGATPSRETKYEIAPGQRTLGGETATAPTTEPGKANSPVATRVATQRTMDVPDTGTPWEQVVSLDLRKLQEIHSNPNPSEQQADYEALIARPERQRQKFLLDMWCSVWFWPIEGEAGQALDAEPILGPQEFYAVQQSPKVCGIVESLASSHHFFHWELEFPEVFGDSRWGFDAVLGNPPWETNEAKTQELFIRYDPAFRTLAGQQAKLRIGELTADPSINREYLDFVESFLASKNFFGFSHEFSKGALGRGMKEKWAVVVMGTNQLPNLEPVPFDRVKGKQNFYTLFTEHALTTSRRGGVIGLIAPSGLYSDANTLDLRRTLLEQNVWEWVFSFENRWRIFPIHSSFKFAAFVVRRGGESRSVKCRFMERDILQWGATNPPFVEITLAQIHKLSPSSFALLEIQDSRDLAIAEGIYSHSTLISETGLTYIQGEYNMTTDSDRFVARERLAEVGYNPSPDGVWRKSAAPDAFPLYEGRMAGLLQFSKKGYVSGRARAAKWRAISPDNPAVEPQYLVMASDAWQLATLGRPGVSYMEVTAATNTRTTIVTLSPTFPHGHATARLLAKDASEALNAAACLGSYAFDFVTRLRVTGTHMTWAVVSDLPTCQVSQEARTLVLAIQSGQAELAPAWVTIPGRRANYLWQALMEEFDEAMAKCFGVSHEDMKWILRPDNPDPRNLWRDYRERLKVLEAAGAKGKWYTLEEARKIRQKAGMEVDF